MDWWWTTIWCQHPIDRLTLFNFYGLPLFDIWFHFTCEPLRQLKFEQSRFSQYGVLLFWKKLWKILKGVRARLNKKNEIFPKKSWSFWSLLNTNFSAKNSYDVELNVYRSIFTKISTLPVDLEFRCIRFFWRQEQE